MKNNKMASLGVRTQFLIAGLVVLAGLAFMAIAGVFAVSSKTDSMSDQADFQQQVVGTMVVSAELRAQVQTHLIAYKDLLLRGSDTSLKAAQEQALAQSDKRITEGFSQLKTQLPRLCRRKPPGAPTAVCAIQPCSCLIPITSPRSWWPIHRFAT